MDRCIVGSNAVDVMVHFGEERAKPKDEALDFMVDLCKFRTPFNLIFDFLRALNLPKLSLLVHADLNTDITLQDIKQAIPFFPSGSAAGHDGFGSFTKNIYTV